MSDRFETLAGTINAAVEMGLRELYTWIPARVVKWDKDKQQADCQILVKQVTEGEDGSREIASWPVVPGVPVVFMGAGGFRMTVPIKAGASGTTGVLMFSHRSLDKWLAGSGAEVDPEFDHDHALTDAVFIAGLMPFGAAWKNAADDYMTIGDDADANGRIAFKSGAIELGEGASKGVNREGDTVDMGTLSYNFSPGTGGASLTISHTPPGGVVPPADTPVAMSSGGRTKAGSGKVTAVD